MEEKSLVLIDAENLINGWRDHNLNSCEKIDYVKLVQILSFGTNLLRAYFYDGVSESISSKKKVFFEALQKRGINLRTKILKSRAYFCEFCSRATLKQIQKGVDVSLATDILRHAFQKTCDICIVVSGDEDYKDAIEVAKDLGIKVWVASFKKSLSKELGAAADKVIFLEDIAEKIRYSPELSKDI